MKPTANRSLRLTLPSRRTVWVPVADALYKPWNGDMPEDTYGGKAVIDWEGRLAFAELAILWSFMAEGWSGVWVDTYRGCFRRSYWEGDPVELDAAQEMLLQRIWDIAGSRSGTFDVFCWRGEEVVFGEGKRRGKDQLRDTQRRWIDAALEAGVSPSALLIVEWDLR